MSESQGSNSLCGGGGGSGGGGGGGGDRLTHVEQINIAKQATQKYPDFRPKLWNYRVPGLDGRGNCVAGPGACVRKQERKKRG